MNLGFGIYFNVLMHQPHIQVPVFLGIKIRPSQKAGQKIELLDPRMYYPVTADLENVDCIPFRGALDKIVKSLHQSSDTGVEAGAGTDRDDFIVRICFVTPWNWHISPGVSTQLGTEFMCLPFNIELLDMSANSPVMGGDL